jgi:hypothetical protein
MALSFKDKLYRLPNFGIDGAVPEYSSLPDWASRNYMTSPEKPAPWPIPPTTPRPNPFPDPLQLRPSYEVDPPEQRAYNYPDYNSNFLVTDNFSRRAVDVPAGGLLALLREVMQRDDRQTVADFGPNTTEDAQPDAKSPDRLLSPPVRMLVARRVRQ